MGSPRYRVCQKTQQPVTPRLQIEMHEGLTTGIDAGHPAGFPTGGIEKSAGSIPFNEVSRRCALCETNHHHFVSLPAISQEMHGSSPRLQRTTHCKCKIGQTERRIGSRRRFAGRRGSSPRHARHGAGTSGGGGPAFRRTSASG